MNRKYAFAVFAFIVICFGASLLLKSKPKPQYTFVERIDGSINDVEWINTKSSIQQMLVTIKKNPNDIKAKLKLASLYINEGRVTGNHAYYDAAALQMIDDVLDHEADNFDALCAKATVLLSQHHFSEAEKLGLYLVKQNPYNAFAAGVLIDAYVELGQYDKAIQWADKMTQLRPDIRSYARIAYLREIIGDYPGAIEAMQMAVNAGIRGLEQTEWCRYNLGKLYEQTGNISAAKVCYDQCIFYRNNYAYANAGLGSIAHTLGQLQTAITYYKRAKTALPDFSFSMALYRLYKADGKINLANAELANAEKLLGANVADETEVHGHYADKEIADLYTAAGQFTKAYTHAMLEYNRRPDNAEINRTLAWIYFNQQQYRLADDLMTLVIKTGTKNPETLLQVAVIKAKLNQPQLAAKYVQDASDVSKVWMPSVKEIFNQLPLQLQGNLKTASL
jgi:tetratricopeptide (TPR) repeat protein